MELEKNGREHDQFNQEIIKIIISKTDNNIISIMMYITKIIIIIVVIIVKIISRITGTMNVTVINTFCIIMMNYESSVILKPAIEDLHNLKRFY